MVIKLELLHVRCIIMGVAAFLVVVMSQINIGINIDSQHESTSVNEKTG